MLDLSVEVREPKPSQGLEVRYRRQGRSAMMISDDVMRSDPNSDELKFLVRAWNAVFAKAKQLCWI
jgi:hypothetical protein